MSRKRGGLSNPGFTSFTSGPQGSWSRPTAGPALRLWVEVPLSTQRVTARTVSHQFIIGPCADCGAALERFCVEATDTIALGCGHRVQGTPNNL